MQVIAKTYDWAQPLVHRTGPPPNVIWHHAAARVATPDDIHRIHLNNGWSGIGYHFYVRKDGRIYRGRPIWAMGAHARGYNDSLGVCAEGNYAVEKEMPKAQLRSLQELHDHLHSLYHGIKDKKHGQVNATACPGSYYPYARVIAGVAPAPVIIKVPVPEKKPAWWSQFRRWLRHQKKTS